MIKLISVFFSYFVVNVISSSYLIKGSPISSLLIDLIFIISLFFIFKKELLAEAKIFNKNKLKNAYIAFFYWVLGSLAMLITSIIINELFPINTLNDNMVKLLINKYLIAMSISTIVFTPIIEDIIFRFIPRQLIKNNFLFILISSLIFSSIHLLFKITTIYDYLLIIPYSCMGIALAASYVKTKNVYTPIMLHMFHNLFVFILTIL